MSDGVNVDDGDDVNVDDGDDVNFDDGDDVNVDPPTNLSWERICAKGRAGFFTFTTRPQEKL